MADQIESIEKEIQKIEEQLKKLQKNKAESALDSNIQMATCSLLKDVKEDLRQQRQKLINKKQ